MVKKYSKYIKQSESFRVTTKCSVLHITVHYTFVRLAAQVSYTSIITNTTHVLWCDDVTR